MNWNNILAYGSIVLACMIFGLSWVCIKILWLHPITIAAIRMSVPVIFVSVYLYHKQISPISFATRGLRTISILNTLRMYFYFVGFTLMTIGSANVVLYSNPLFAVAFAAMLLGEKIHLYKYISIWFACSGTILIMIEKWMQFDTPELIGMLALLCSALLQWYTTVVFKKQLQSLIRPVVMRYQCIVWAVVFLATSLIFYPIPHLRQLGVTSIYAFAIGIVWFGLFFWGLKHLPAGDTSILTYTEMIFGIVFAYLFWSETPTIMTLVGASCMLISGRIIRYCRNDR